MDNQQYFSEISKEYILESLIKASTKGQDISDDDYIDISKVDIVFGDGEVCPECGRSDDSTLTNSSNRKVKQLQGLEPDKFFLFKNKELPYVMNIKSQKVMTVNSPKTHGENSRNKYPCVNVGKVVVALHRLVAICFLNNPDPVNKLEVDHINGDKNDWRPENLCWITPSENNSKAKRGL